jgi:WD40 repeat protein
MVFAMLTLCFCDGLHSLARGAIGENGELAPVSARLVATLDGCGGIGAAFGDKGGIFLSVGSDGARTWSTRDWTPLTAPLFLHDGTPIRCFALAADETKLLLAGGKEVSILDPRTGAPIRRLSFVAEVHHAAFDPKGARVAVGCEDGLARVFDVQSGKVRASFKCGHTVSFVLFSPDGRRLFVVAGWAPHLYDLETQKEQDVDDWSNADAVERAGLPPAAFSADGNALVIGFAKSYRVYDVATGRRTAENTLLRPSLHWGWVQWVGTNVNGTRVFILSNDWAQIWDVANGTQAIPDIPMSDVTGNPKSGNAAIGSHGECFGCSSLSGGLGVWGLQPGRGPNRWRLGDRGFEVISIDRTGARAATGYAVGKLTKIWELTR